MIKNPIAEFLAVMLAVVTTANAAAGNPTILVSMGDDVGWMIVASCGGDIMGVKTQNIDRIEHEGIRLTSLYAQPSCTAGRAAFLRDQLAVRTGLTTVDTILRAPRPGSPADIVLSVDGSEVARTVAKITVPGAFTASETFDVGTDLGSPVSSFYDDLRPFEFVGNIHQITVALKQ